MTDHTSRRTVLGVLIDWSAETYQQLFLTGVFDYAREHDLDCICFEGGALNSPFTHEAARNVAYDLPGPENVDGLAILSASISHYIPQKNMESFFRKFESLPLVSVALEMPGVPSVMVDNQRGLRSLITHLARDHGVRRFAFIRGPAENADAQERYHVFEETLKELGVTVNSLPVYEGDFTLESGSRAMAHFKAQGLEGIDAVMAANDLMALGAMNELTRSDPQALQRLIITGFDDIEVAAYSSPTLTTISQPIHELGSTSARLLHDRIRGRTVPPLTLLPTHLVIRESCHCQTSSLPAGGGDARHLYVANGSSESVRNTRALPALLMELLSGDLTDDTSELFTATCAAIGVKPSLAGFDYTAFENLVQNFWTAVGASSGSALSTAARNACFKAILNLGKKVNHEERERIRTSLRETKSMVLIREVLSTFNNERQMDILADRLPDVDLRDCYIALYYRDSGQALQILAYRAGGRIDQMLPDRIFPAKNLVADDFLSDGRPHAVIVKALRAIGFVMFSLEPENLRLIGLLSDILAGALQAAELFEELNVQKNGISRNLSTLRQAMAGFIQTMSATVESRDPYTAGHQRRVSDLARTIAQELGLTSHEIEGIRMAGIIHDLGKIYVPSEILNRSGLLDDIEFSMIKRHPQVAYDILKNVDFPWPIADIVYQHHERLNGSGYPKGLVGDDIRIEARILAVADVVEAMASHRPYREALGVAPALEEIKLNRGTLYDPDVVDACLRLFRENDFAFRK